jgi:hypothetical protein
MRQIAADQGGITQQMVREPIRRTKQLPDGTLIYSESLPKPVQRPNVGVRPNRPKPLIRLDNLGLPFPTLKPKPSPEEIEREALDKWWQKFQEETREFRKTPEEREEERKRKKRQEELYKRIGPPRKGGDPNIP